MNLFLSIFAFFLTNTFIYFYSFLSKNSTLTGWKVFLIPFMFFPVIYGANVAFAYAWSLSGKLPLSISALGIINLGVAAIVFLLCDFFFLKQIPTMQVFAGAILILAGGALITWK